MSVIYLLLALSLLIATGFLVLFIGAVRGGQYDDTGTPAMRMLTDDEPGSPKKTHRPGSKTDHDA